MKFFHTALSVKNLKESQAFYEEVFGFHLKAQGERPEIKVKFVILENSDGVGIELFEHDKPIPLSDDLMDFQKNGFKHIAFIVENIEEVIEKAQRHGAKILWSVRKGVTIKRLAFISDPNGLPIELAEI